MFDIADSFFSIILFLFLIVSGSGQVSGSFLVIYLLLLDLFKVGGLDLIQSIIYSCRAGFVLEDLYFLSRNAIFE